MCQDVYTLELIPLVHVCRLAVAAVRGSGGRWDALRSGSGHGPAAARRSQVNTSPVAFDGEDPAPVHEGVVVTDRQAGVVLQRRPAPVAAARDGDVIRLVTIATAR
ncbi:hypothetical protein SEVIR_4G051150v4 [Setaria viridis]